MWIKDLWDRLLAKFNKKEDVPGSEPVMELRPEAAPEPVPERKTSDEMIIEMAQSAQPQERSAVNTDAEAEETAWEIHEDTDPAEEPVAEETVCETPIAETAAWEVQEDTDPADEPACETPEAETAAWEVQEDTDPVDEDADDAAKKGE